MVNDESNQKHIAFIELYDVLAKLEDGKMKKCEFEKEDTLNKALLKEEAQSKTKMQDEGKAEKINKEDGELKVKPDTTADEAVADAPKLEKSIKW